MARTTKRNRHNAALVVGSVIGGVAGAAVALWKTPYSGPELRAKLTGGSGERAGASTGHAPRFSSRLLSSVENTLAPVVGVRLGQTANEGQGSTAASASPAVAASATAPVGAETPAGGVGTAAPGTASGELEPEGIGHAATTEELTTPQIDVTPEALKQEEGELTPFPKLDGTEKT